MVTRLLSGMCDAVVPVEQSLCIGVEGSAQLAALLMHHTAHNAPKQNNTEPIRPLQGASLLKLVKSEEDQQRLQDFMMRELSAARTSFATEAPVASSLHIHLRDAIGIPVPVECFCSCSLGAEGGGIGPLRYLIGIRQQGAVHVMQQERRQHKKGLESQELAAARPKKNARLP